MKGAPESTRPSSPPRPLGPLPLVFVHLIKPLISPHMPSQGPLATDVASMCACVGTHVQER